MKRLTLEEWERKYIVGVVERFDQKYTMFNRPDWDSKAQERLQDWSFMGEAKDRPGWTLEELGLRRATGRVTQMFTLFNTSKPNTSRATRAIMEAMVALNPGTQAAANKPPGVTKIDISNPQRITSIIKKVAAYFGADTVGICKLERRWIYSHTYEADPYRVGSSEKALGTSKSQEIPGEFQYAVVMGFQMDYNLYKYFTSPIAGIATGLGYSQMGFTNAFVSEYIRNLGFKVIDCSTNDVALSIPMAMQSGLGELGRNGLLITPEFGPRVRISKVITDLPLVADSPIEFGVTAFCEACGKCAETCPSRSIMFGERTAEPNNVSNAAGELKWPIDAETCRMYWARAKRGGGCTNCISSCPYNKVNTWPHRTVQWFTDHARWADSFYVKMDDLLGYGKPKKPDNFWEEWQPKNH